MRTWKTTKMMSVALVAGAATFGFATATAFAQECPSSAPLDCGTGCCPYGSGGSTNVCCPDNMCTSDGNCGSGGGSGGGDTNSGGDTCPSSAPLDCGTGCCPYGSGGSTNVCCPDNMCTSDGSCGSTNTGGGTSSGGTTTTGGDTCPADAPLDCGTGCCPYGSGGSTNVCCPDNMCTSDGSCGSTTTTGGSSGGSTTTNNNDTCPADAPLDCGTGCCPYGSGGSTDVCCPDNMCTSNGTCGTGTSTTGGGSSGGGGGGSSSGGSSSNGDGSSSGGCTVARAPGGGGGAGMGGFAMLAMIALAARRARRRIELRGGALLALLVLVLSASTLACGTATQTADSESVGATSSAMTAPPPATRATYGGTPNAEMKRRAATVKTSAPQSTVNPMKLYLHAPERSVSTEVVTVGGAWSGVAPEGVRRTAAEHTR